MEKTDTSKESITFKLDADVQGMLHLALKASTGRPVFGMKSHLGNEAFRAFLPDFLRKHKATKA